jgi:hypothetical protein
MSAVSIIAGFANIDHRASLEGGAEELSLSPLEVCMDRDGWVVVAGDSIRCRAC